MKKILCGLVLLSALMTCTANATDAAESDLPRSIYLAMLLKEDASVSLYGARTLGQLYSKDVGAMDHVAERMIQLAGPAIPKGLIGSVTWYATVLGDSGNPRYVDVLTEARQKFDAPQVHTRIDAALVKLGAKQGDQYVRGALDLNATRQQIEAARSSQDKSIRKQFNGVYTSQGFAKVLAEIGAPDDMSTMTIRMAYSRGSKLVAHYLGHGAIVLTLRNDTEDKWSVVEAIDEAFPVADLYQGKNAGIAQMIGSLRGGGIRDYLKFHGSVINRDAGLVAVLAKRLETIKFPADKLEDDGHAIAMRMIANRAKSDAVMMESLKRIAATNSGKKTKAAALKYVSSIERRQALPEEPAEANENEGEEVGDGDAR
jgi:hypothetical protein